MINEDVSRHRPDGLKPDGLQLPREGRRVWRYDSRPAANVTVQSAQLFS